MSNSRDRADLDEHQRAKAAQERGSDDVGSNSVSEKQVTGCSVRRFWHKRPWDGKAHGSQLALRQDSGFSVTHTLPTALFHDLPGDRKCVPQRPQYCQFPK